MKKLLLIYMLAIAGVASAQTTSVTGNITDSDTIAWANSAVNFILYNPNPQIQPTCNGTPMPQSQTNFSVPSDGSGNFSTSVCSTSFIIPAQTMWLVTICSNTSAPCQSLQLQKINGGSLVLTPIISAQITAIRLAASPTTRAYADVEIQPTPPTGGTYYNVISNTTRQWNGTAWVNSGGGGTSQLVSVDSYGAKGDGVTNDCTALQACLNAQTVGQCYLGPKTYFIGSSCTLTINKSDVGFVGAGIVETNTGLFITPPGSMILSSSPSTDIIDAWGTDGLHNIYGNIFKDFTMARSVVPNSGLTGPPATGPAGLSLKYSYGAIIEHTASEDSGFGYFFHAVGSGGVGHFNDNIAEFGYNGVTETTGEYTGFWMDSVNGEPSPSVRIYNNNVASNGLNPNGPNVLGYVLSGSAYNDFMAWNLESAGVNYGTFINTTGATGIGAQDIHFRNSINDAVNFSCIYITGATTAMTSTIDIDGGWCQDQGQSSPGMHFIGSNNIVVRGVQFSGAAGMNWAVLADTTPNSNIALIGNNVLTQTGGFSLVGGSDYTVKDNLLHSLGTGTLLSLSGSPAHIASGGNVFSGTGTGVNVASGTTDMKGLEVDTFDPGLTTSITSAIPFLVPPLGTEIVTFSATPTFSYLYKASIITLTANITSFTLAAGVDTEAKTLIFCENATGGFTVAPPANVRGLTVGTTLSKCTTAYLIYNANQSAWMTQGEVQNQ